MMRYGLARGISILVTALLGSAAAIGSGLVPHQEFKASIKGKVIGVNSDVGIPDVRVLVQSATANRDVTTDKSGNYEIELPSDVYTITATVQGYYPYRRAPFRGLPGTVTVINLNLAYIPHDTGFGDTPKTYYEELALPDTLDSHLDLLVEYENRKEHGEFIEYNGATVYYDALAVSATTVKLNKRDLSFKATGNVHVDDGQRSHVYVRQADIRFAGSNPIVALTFGAVDYIRGKGSIGGDNINFDFRIDKDRAGQFTYEDKKAGISFTSKLYSFRVIDDGANKVEFVGRAQIKFRGGDEDLKVVEDYNIPIQFVVVVQDNRNTGPDTFSISIDLDSVLKRSGSLSKGDIEAHRQY